MRQSSPSPSPSPSPGPPTNNARPKSNLFPSPLSPSPTPSSSTSTGPSHVRGKSSFGASLNPVSSDRFGHGRNLSKGDTPQSSTFAPSFIKSEDMRRGSDVVDGIEGENDFSGKRYVWLKDPQTAFVKGWVVEELEGNRILVQCDDGSVSYHLSWLGAAVILTPLASNERSTPRALTRSIPRNLTRLTTWPSSHI